MASKKRILVVDDEVDICWTLRHMLQAEGVEVLTATSGAEALKLAEDRPFRLVFLDVKLPDIDGLEVAQRIKAISPATKIIIISAHYYSGDPKIQSKLKSGLISGFLSKPIHLSVVQRIVAENAITEE